MKTRVVQSPGDLRTVMLAAWPPMRAFSFRVSATTLYDLRLAVKRKEFYINVAKILNIQTNNKDNNRANFVMLLGHCRGFTSQK